MRARCFFLRCVRVLHRSFLCCVAPLCSSAVFVTCDLSSLHCPWLTVACPFPLRPPPPPVPPPLPPPPLPGQEQQEAKRCMYSGELDGAPWTGQAPPSRDDMDTEGEEEPGPGACHPSKVCVGVCMCVWVCVCVYVCCVCLCSARKGCPLFPSRARVFSFHLSGRSLLGLCGTRAAFSPPLTPATPSPNRSSLLTHKPLL
jgi:hypothetical protein